ncbi:MAG: hypothetical protein KKF85_08040 [Gammaproteobacteria bacterium]|nr:hypothetical protein [Rhodocyclaceae bacterium]MBU3910148.1 hypothetical protein [Gammaproteobacteria bacterium]MBU3990041.1 hypothetical protein [Gammaproteobacteria bacterium]MBU4006155.1 hypothetical protein [Gammaproteobacteria bacterium]MBU4022610.1 hypothetical protein [Gammaproteobacteria bacterium]
MSTVINTAPKLSRLADLDMQAAPAALIRAAQRAREIATRTHTPLVINKNGKLVEEIVQPTLADKE